MLSSKNNDFYSFKGCELGYDLIAFERVMASSLDNNKNGRVMDSDKGWLS